MARASLLRLALCTLAGACAPAAAQTLETALMPGQVIQGHAKLEGQCTSCHVRFDRAAQTGLCLDCHKDVARDYERRSGYHGRLTQKECRSCHTEHKGRDARIAALERSFDHRNTDFPLRGAHAAPKLRCEACHVPPAKFRDAPSGCNACHEKDDAHRGTLGTACADCHVETGWKQTRFDHGRTRFPLRNRHADVPCRGCHKDAAFKDAPLACVACHRGEDQKKGHQGRFGDKCETCHADTGWKQTTFRHDRDTKYPLQGAHRLATCHSCHRAATPHEKPATACVACHKVDDAKKGHRGRFGAKCESCHVETGWKATRFDHARDTRYALRGRHGQAKCASCHTGVLYQQKLATTCVSCHRADDMAKGHRGMFGSKCESCHVESGWKATRFDHARDTRYPLRGRHAKARCESCHAGGIYTAKPDTACASCHRKDDAHRGQLGVRCESCHEEATWRQAAIDHGLTRFPLLGGHAKAKCKDCHASAQFKDAPTDCHACHRKDDKHALRLGTKCEQCHQPRSWRAWDFDHDRRTRFALDGRHRGLDCLACHKSPLQGSARLSGACASCHEDVDVHHGAFGQQCQRCHVTSSFKTIRSGGTGRLFQ